ncbi:solute carrier family 26 member 6-like isoform X2 [Diorhabda carinulata]|uniref:solute carrier family 26 member 6-like isoform X2 n=1 Tax=Diorhabda carinulata TaxID=1163345 RepID=UPI0025A0EE02|nr:solute carrier family 26 member 6-like isoform X2 [Diorhabda carinulata]
MSSTDPIMTHPYVLRRKHNFCIMKKDGEKHSALLVERPVYQIEELNRDYEYEKPYHTLKARCRRACNSVNPSAWLKETIPLLSWLPEYNWKKNFSGDIISGITVAIMHIPQGMAYALLGNVPPIIGIYMAFFPVLVYFVFGTSRHVSIGTFAVVCLMTGKVVSQYTTIEIMQNGTQRSLISTGQGEAIPQYTNVQVAITITFTVAMIQLVMYLLRLGMVSQLLSETLVNGFTCASAFQVVGSQLKDFFGLDVGKRRGNFQFPLAVYDAIFAIPKANINAILVSFTSFILLIINNELFKPWLSKRFTIPFPIELVVVVFGTASSYFMNFESNYNITVVGYIPTGLPKPTLPAFELIPDIFLESFIITMVSYTITMSMALIFARKLMYEVDSNQELLALGLSNTVGSFFSCLPITASLSRSMIQQTVGGVTQLVSVVSASILLAIVLWIGPVFETLPKCVLASIIVVALKGMLLQCKSLPRYWRLSRWDAVVWIITFSVTLFIQISYGLAAGVAISLLSIFIQGHKPYTCLLGIVPNTDLYLDIKRYKGAKEIDGVKIFHYSGGLSFASRSSFKELLVKKTELDAAATLRRRAKLTEKGLQDEEELLLKCVILDFSSLTFVDPAGVDFLRSLQDDYKRLNIHMLISGCSGPVFEVMHKCDEVEKKEKKFLIFPTVHDAVLYTQVNVLSKNE